MNKDLKADYDRLDEKKFAIIGGSGNHDMDRHIINWINDAASTDFAFMRINVEKFHDSEPDSRIEEYEKIKGKIVIIFQSTYRADLMDELLELAWAAKYQYGAIMVIVVIGFLRFRRQEHDEKMYEINRNRMIIHELRGNGVDKAIFCDIHSQKTLDNCVAEGIQACNVSSANSFAEYLKSLLQMTKLQKREFYVYSPDEGSVQRGIALAKILGVDLLLSLKNRPYTITPEMVEDMGRIEEIRKANDFNIWPLTEERVRNATICVTEDEVSSGNTAFLSGKHLDELGSKENIFCATHSICTSGWKRNMIDTGHFSKIFLGCTIPFSYEKEANVITPVRLSKPIGQQLLTVMYQTQQELFGQNPEK